MLGNGTQRCRLLHTPSWIPQIHIPHTSALKRVRPRSCAGASTYPRSANGAWERKPQHARDIRSRGMLTLAEHSMDTPFVDLSFPMLVLFEHILQGWVHRFATTKPISTEWQVEWASSREITNSIAVLKCKSISQLISMATPPLEFPHLRPFNRFPALAKCCDPSMSIRVTCSKEMMMP